MAWFQRTADRAIHVCTNELFGAANGPIHVAFGREVNDSSRLVILQQIAYQSPVADVSVDKPVARIGKDQPDVVDIPGIGELV
jgi:hypothetical protein